MEERRRLLLNTGSIGNNDIGAVVGDICCANSNGDKIFIKMGDSIPDGYSVIGVVVIPSSHDVYGTGECAIMSVNFMNYSTPDTGGASGQYIYWGGHGTDISNLTNFTVVNYVGSKGNVNKTVQGTTEGAYLPSDTFSTVNGLDGIANYFFNSNSKYCPSPYNSNGSRNEAYYTTDYSQYNVLSDFDGVSNTKILTDLATGQSDWKTATSITNNSGSTYYPAACCCWRYHTVGTNQGDWYLPACGELGYVCVRQGVINTTLQYLIDNQLVTNCSLVSMAYYGLWSSSEYSNNHVHYIDVNKGLVYHDYKNYFYFTARAFTRVPYRFDF